MSVALFSTALFSTALGTWVLLASPGKTLNKLFFGLCLSVSGWAAVIGLSKILFAYGIDRSLGSIGLGYLFGCSIPLFFYLTCTALNDCKINKPIHFFVFAGYTLCVLVGFKGYIVKKVILTDSAQYYDFETGSAFPLFVLYVSALLCLSAKELRDKYLKAGTSTERLHLTYFAFGTGASFVVALICNVVLPSLDISWLSPYGAASPLIGLCILGIAIARHDLLGIRTSFPRTTTIALWLAIPWIPVTLYFLIPKPGTGASFMAQYWLPLGIIAWLATLLAIVGSRETNPFSPSRESGLDPLRPVGPRSLNKSANLYHARDLMEAMIHDLSSSLNLSLIQLNRTSKIDKNSIIRDLRAMLKELHSISFFLNCQDTKQSTRLCNLEELVETVLYTKKMAIQEKDISVLVGSLGNVMGDPFIIKHILSNVIDNAVKYVGDKTRATIHISSSPLANGLEVIVKDNGIGIPKNELAYICKPLRRGTRQKVAGMIVEGTGIGLAIVSHLLAGMGGEVSIRSEAGVGTTVHIFFPRAANGENNLAK